MQGTHDSNPKRYMEAISQLLLQKRLLIYFKVYLFIFDLRLFILKIKEMSTSSKKLVLTKKTQIIGGLFMQL